MLGLKKISRGIRRIGHKIHHKAKLGAKSLHKVADYGKKIGGGLTTVGTLTGQPEIVELGAGVTAGSEVASKGGSLLEKV